MKKKILLVLFCSLCATVTASAQAIDDYVYVTDEIIHSKLGTQTGVKEQSVSLCAKYNFKAYNDKSNQRFYFNDGAIRGALTTTITCGYLRKIVIEGESNLTSYPLAIYVKDTPYTGYSDLYDATADNDGTLLSDFTYKSSNQILEKDLTADYSYLAIKNGTTNAAPYLKKISLTWQLVYFRFNLTSGTLGTLCLPYGIKAEDMDGITAYSIAGKTVENDVVTSLIFNEVDHIEAGKPYIFVANSTEIALKYHGDKVETPINENGMYGVYEQHPFADDASHNANYYVISNNIVQAASKNSGVNANCVYIRMNEVPPYNNSAQSSKRALIITSEGFTQTDVTPTLLNVPASSSLSNNAVDLSGRRVAKGTAPTISIINGKKTLAR